MNKKTILTIFISLFLIIFIIQPALAKYEVEVGIPGYNKTLPYKEAGSQLSAYLKALFTFLISIVGITGMFFIIYGGFAYMMSGGNASKTGEAKDRIIAAISGLVLVLCSVLVLEFINPELASPNLPGLEGITKTDFDPTRLLPKLPKIGDGGAWQVENQSCSIQDDCKYDLKCELAKTEYRCKANEKIFATKPDCEKDKDCNSDDCQSIEKKVCKKHDLTDKIGNGKVCEDTALNAPEGKCFDNRLVCRPETQNDINIDIKKCLLPSTGICKDDNDCDQTLGKKLVCGGSYGDNLCQTEAGEILDKKTDEGQDDSKTDLFAIPSPKTFNDISYAYVPIIYLWGPRGQECPTEWSHGEKEVGIKGSSAMTGEFKNILQSVAVCDYFTNKKTLSAPVINDREFIDSSSNKDDKIVVYSWARKKAKTDPSTGKELKYEGADAIKYYDPSCDYLKPENSWKKTDQKNCEKIERDLDTEHKLCCEDKRTIFCCFQNGKVTNKEGWLWRPWPDDCEQALSGYYTDFLGLFNFIPGACYQEYQKK